MTPIPTIARAAAARFEADDNLSLQDCIAAACVEAVAQDREAEDRLKDETLYLPVGFVQNLKRQHAGQLAAISAALNGDLYPGVTLEMLARNLYHENQELRAQDKERQRELEVLSRQLVEANYAAEGFRQAAVKVRASAQGAQEP